MTINKNSTIPLLGGTGAIDNLSYEKGIKTAGDGLLQK